MQIDLKQNHKHSLRIRRGENDKVSPFTVDLIAVEAERLLAAEEGSRQRLFLDYFRFGRYSAVINRTGRYFRHIWSRSKSIPGPDARQPAHAEFPEDSNGISTENNPEKYVNLRRLTFFAPARFLFILTRIILKYSYVLCFWTGWAALFLIRFIWFSGTALNRMLIRSLKIIQNRYVRQKRFSVAAACAISVRSCKRLFRSVLSSVKKVFPQRRDTIRPEPEKYSGSVFKQMAISREYNAAIPNGRLGVFRPALVFTIILLSLALPLKVVTHYRLLDLSGLRGRVLGASEEAVGELKEAAGQAAAFDFDRAGERFTQASEDFLVARTELEAINGVIFPLVALLPNEEFRLASDAKHIVAAGEAGANLGVYLSLVIQDFIKVGEDDGIMDSLRDIGKNVEAAAISARTLESELKAIDAENIPPAYRDKFNMIRGKSGKVISSLEELSGLINDTRVFLGEKNDKRYMFIFQNNAELRATGGFVGSFALVDFREGRIIKIEAPGGGSYDTEAGLYDRITAPEPLSIVNPLWHFWDANWWPDWPTSARKLMWFLEKSGGPTVDGVISLTPTVVERLLAIIGPVDMTESYGVVISAGDFWDIIEGFAEQKPSLTSAETARDDPVQSGNEQTSDLRDNPDVPPALPSPDEPLSSISEPPRHEPKKIIGDMMVKILDELPDRLDQGTLVSLAGMIERSIDEKHILLYFSDIRLQSKLESLGWDGILKPTAWDYISVINTNIAGGKSDRKISEEIDLHTEIMPDGTIINTLIVRRTHYGVKREQFTGVRNNDWMRIYVPLGSELITASGFSRPGDEYFEEPDPAGADDPGLANENNARIHAPGGTKIYEESGKTVFANWSQVDPGETAVLTFKYSLPFRFEPPVDDTLIGRLSRLIDPGVKQPMPYALLVQKQPGTAGSAFHGELVLPDDFNIVWRYPDGTDVSGHGWTINDKLDTDKYWAIIAEK